ncbi:PRKC apoptosis WT1 regulator protein-like isoform X1 [Brienomyrus brachyistius]|uniref:PRKC apoptosis WT1 regulator protein-like isoform X1 n=1 Tax=Brienomyrus brachyistius TaxID=42636 RepID=UPI0020B41395|nr:PRKC apoptosis WT1 regulator protein-like isoform X1 [Brienomyrus brachyistius]
MASGGFRSNSATDFLEEWKAKREKLRAKMLGDIAASTGASLGAPGKNETRIAAAGSDANGGGNLERGGSASVLYAPSHPVLRSSSASALRRPDDEPHPIPTTRTVDLQGGGLKKTPQAEKLPGAPLADSGGAVCQEGDKDSMSPGGGSSAKSKEKKSSGPSARKGKGQIEKRKLREKRRSTGVVSIPSNESLDELDDDDEGQKERKTEEALTQLNTAQNETMSLEFGAAHSLQETSRPVAGRYKSAGGLGHEEDAAGNGRHRQSRASTAALERRIEELEKELALERQENARMLKGLQDKDELVGKLKEEINLLYRDLDDVEDENEQLKQENKTLLKVVGQLTR